MAELGGKRKGEGRSVHPEKSQVGAPDNRGGMSHGKGQDCIRMRISQGDGKAGDPVEAGKLRGLVGILNDVWSDLIEAGIPHDRR